MGVFKRSWEITKATFNVMKQDKEIIWFPILAFIFSAIFIAAILVPTIIINLLQLIGFQLTGVEYLLIFVTYLILAIIAVFFNVCVVYTAAMRFNNKNSKFGEAIKFAFKRFGKIFSWAMLSATVGLILKILENLASKAKGAGKILLYILRGILGLTWAISTIFVVPSIVYHNLSPFKAIKKSVNVLKKTWGETIIKAFGLGTVFFLIFLLEIIIAVILILISIPFGVGGILIAIGISLVIIILTGMVYSAANSIFDTALYVYAETGKVPKPYTQEQMKGAFKQKKGLKILK